MSAPSTKPLKVLIVEDQFLIAKQLEMIVLSAGHSVVGTASSSIEAQELAATTMPDLALVDISLADGITGTDVGKFIVDECGAAVVFTTANARRIPDDLCGAVGVVEKPFARNDISQALKYLSAHLVGLRPINLPDVPVKPNGLRLSPSFSELWGTGTAA